MKHGSVFSGIGGFVDYNKLCIFDTEMANKYTAYPSPPKSELEYLYGKTQKMVFVWFRKYNIKSRIAAKRNQEGEKNHSWKGDNATYAALHYRVISARGKPNKCENCKTTKAKRFEWANLTGKYDDIYDYTRMCVSCHRKYDRESMRRNIKQINKRYEWDKKVKSQR